MPLPPSADQRKALKSAAKLRLGFCRLLSGKAEQVSPNIQARLHLLMRLCVPHRQCHRPGLLNDV